MKCFKTVSSLALTAALLFVLPIIAQEKPLTQDQVNSLVREGLRDETGAKAIEQRGIDFVPAEDFIQSIKIAGLTEAFLELCSEDIDQPQMLRGVFARRAGK